MKHMQLKHWQDPVIGALGIWLAVSPWVLGFAGTNLAIAAIVLGLALVLVAAGALFRPLAWERWTAFAIGLVTIASPWLMGAASMGAAMVNAVVVGLVAALLAIWVLALDGAFGHTSGDRLAH